MTHSPQRRTHLYGDPLAVHVLGSEVGQRARLRAPHRGPESSFDVVATDLERVLEALRALREENRDAGLAPGPERVARFEQRFHALERAAIVLLGPEGFATERGRKARAQIAQLRGALARRRLPDAPSAWARPWPKPAGPVGAWVQLPGAVSGPARRSD